MTRCLTIVGNGEQAAGAAADEQGEEDGRGRAVPEGDNNHSDPTVHVIARPKWTLLPTLL